MTSRQVADTIIEQIEGLYNFNINGHKISFFKMVGASQIMYGDNFLQFKVSTPKHKGKIVITLNSMDTYDIEFWKGKMLDMKKVKEINDVYFDQLTSILVEELGI